MKRFADFAEDAAPLDGDKESIEKIVGVEIVVTGFKIRKSKFSKNVTGEYLTLQYERDGKTFVCFTGSDVLIDQIKRYAHEIPFMTQIKKIKRFFTFT